MHDNRELIHFSCSHIQCCYSVGHRGGQPSYWASEKFSKPNLAAVRCIYNKLPRQEALLFLFTSLSIQYLQLSFWICPTKHKSLTHLNSELCTLYLQLLCVFYCPLDLHLYCRWPKNLALIQMDFQFTWTATRPERSYLRTKPSAYSRLSKYTKILSEFLKESISQHLCWESQFKAHLYSYLITTSFQAYSRKGHFL